MNKSDEAVVLIIKEYPKIYRLNDHNTEGIFTKKGYLSKKLDGSNGRVKIGVGPHGFIIGSRSQEFFEKPEVERGSPWPLLWEYIEKRLPIIDTLPPSWVLFGEVHGSANKHKILYPHPFDYAVFDVWDETEERFLRPDEWMDAIKTVQLSIIDHEYLECSYELIESLMKSLQPYRDLYEGYVFKTYRSDKPDGILYGKIYHEDLRPSEPIREELKILVAWITERRVLNVLHAGFDEGKTNEGMGIMQWLPSAVWRDAVLEEFGNYVLDETYPGKIIHLDIRWMKRQAVIMVKGFLEAWLEQQSRHSQD